MADQASLGGQEVDLKADDTLMQGEVSTFVDRALYLRKRLVLNGYPCKRMQHLDPLHIGGIGEDRDMTNGDLAEA